MSLSRPGVVYQGESASRLPASISRSIHSPENGPPQPRVLIANSDSFSRIYFRRAILRCAKVAVHDAHNGVDALELLSINPFQVLILDLDLPLLSGLELLEFIHGDPMHEKLQVIITTAVSHQQAVRQAIALGVSDYLLKPYQQNLVEERLERALRRSQEAVKTDAATDDSSGARILVADRDRNFCDTVQSVLSAVSEVRAAHSIPELLSATLRWKPHFLWMHPEMAGSKLDFVLRKVGAIRRENKVRIYAISENPLADQQLHPLIDGWVEKTFVPEQLTKRFYEIASASEVFLDDAKSRFDSIQPEVRSAVRQVFGMMTGVEAITAPRMPDAPGDMSARLSLHDPKQSVYIQLLLSASSALTTSLCTHMMGVSDEEADDEIIDSVLQEMLNIVGGRIKSCYEPLGFRFEMGLPERVLNADASLVEGKFSETHYFQWESFEPFSVALCQGFGEMPRGGSAG